MLGRKALRGAAMMLSQGVVGRAISFVSQMLLAALLRPEIFGLIALTYTVTSVAALLTNMGVDDVVLQRGPRLRFWIGPALWINGGLGLLAGLLIAAVAPIAGMLYREPSLAGLLWVLAASIPLGAFATVPGLVMRSRLQFGFLASYGTAEAVIQAVLTVALAWDGYGAYSFVLPVPVIAAVRMLVWWWKSGLSADLNPQVRRWRYLFRNTSTHFLTKSILVGISQCDYVVLGFTTAHAEVGLYYFGFRLAVQPLWILAGSISSIMVPVFVQLEANRLQQAEAALKASRMLCFSIMPIMLAQAAVAPAVIATVFGNDWVSSIPIVQLLSIGFAFDAVSWVAGALLIARGEFAFGLKLLLLQGPAFLVMVLVGAEAGGSIGVAWALCIYYVLIQPIHAYAIFRRAGLGTRAILETYSRPGSYSVIAVGAALAVVSALPGPSRPLLGVVLLLILSGLAYAGLLRLFSPAVWNDLSARLHQAVKPALA